MSATNRIHCTWCGAVVVGGRQFCAACGRPVAEPEFDDEDDGLDQPVSPNSSRKVLGGLIEVEPKDSVAPHQTAWTVLTLALIAAIVMIFWQPWQTDGFDVRETASAPCHGWLEWEAAWPESSVLFPVHWALLDGEQLSKEEYREWGDIVDDVRSDMEDAPQAPYALKEYLRWTDLWLQSLDYMLATLHNRGEVLSPQIDYSQLDYRADQMGIEWSNAILECQPSDRT